MLHRIAAILLVTSWLCAGDAPVAVGKGSYAPSPPADNREIAELLARKPLIEAESAGRPLPTNDWWTTLLTEPWPSRMYARPTIVGADGGGVRIWLPQGWNADGNAMDEGEPLEIQAVDRAPATAGGDLTVCDFETERWPDGWRIEGRAWGDGPTATTQQAGEGVVGRRWAMSFANGGDGAQGVATSPPFRIERRYLHLLVAGGKDGQARIELLVAGKAVQTAVGRNSRTLAATVWDVGSLKGTEARLRLVDATGGGWGWIGVDQVVQSDRAEPGSGGLLRTCSTLRWGDWTVAMRLRADETRWLDATFGHGLPYVWIESQGLDLHVPCDPTGLSDIAGKPLRLPATGDAVVVRHDGRTFALYAPERTRFEAAGDGLDLRFANPGKRFLSVAVLSAPSDAAGLQKTAYAVPRDSRLTWRLDQAAGEVVTTWTVTAEALRGTSTEVLQGWLPHQWRGTRHQLKLDGPVYATPRGALKTATGSSFEIAWPFRGVMPMLPAPTAIGPHPYDAARMARWMDEQVAEYDKQSADKRAGQDTYWGGKATLKLVQVWTIAEEMHHPAAERLRGQVREAMSDWFTWTPGEQARYFCRYPAPWSGLVGLKTSFGSGSFTDNHFHYGYHVLAAALLGRYDRTWLADYGPMARLVAKQFANWDREDRDFPFLRTFDPWHGHSYAGGLSSPKDGNNQESTSESMQSWAGVFLLGSALGDQAMTAAGAMGYAIESSAVYEYWLDYHGWKDGAAAGNHPPAYSAKHSMASVMRDRDFGFWTWFSGRPIHVYGIQFIPTWHWMSYLGRDPAFMTWQIDSMAKRESKSERTDLLALGDDWGVLACIGALAFGDPGRVTALFDEAAATHAKIDGRGSLIQYWIAHTLQAVGHPAGDLWTDLPTSMVYRQNDGAISVTAWNPGNAAVTVQVMRAGRAVASFDLAPGELAIRRDLPGLMR
jgi:endoglucanase Acf2